MPTVTVTLARRWGSNKAGSKVEVSEAKAAFLVGIGVAEGAFVYNEAAVNPGSDGPDPVASGDPTRRRPKTVRGNREGNRAEPAAGSPPVPSYGRKSKAQGEVAGKHTREEAEPTGRRLTSTRWNQA